MSMQKMRPSALFKGSLVLIIFLILFISIKSWLTLQTEMSLNKNPAQSISAKYDSADSRSLNIVDSNTARSNPNDPRKKLKNKIIHLDLKGMPPRVKYFAKIFPLFKSLGATGILIEYEDMFPYTGPLASIANTESYTPKEVAQINALALENNLEVIPLIQTFGHMEFVLKTEKYFSLREVPKYPQVLCPSNNGSLVLIKTMIDQILSLHPNINSLHIGSDEVYHIGLCPVCTSRMSKMASSNPKIELFMEHVKSVVEYVKINHKKKVLMWDDEFRQVEESVIVNSGLGSMVEIVVWNYQEDVDKRLDGALWAKYGRTFPSIWVGSSFKGANRPDSMVVNETHYLLNHYSWVKTLEMQAKYAQPSGIILTGWQRYDHFSVPCELLAVSIPSLAACMIYLQSTRDYGMEKIFHLTNSFLNCEGEFYRCSNIGSKLYDLVQRLERLTFDFSQFKSQPMYGGWGNEASLRLSFSNPSLIEHMMPELSRIKFELDELEPIIIGSLGSIYPKWSINEWMSINFYPKQKETDNIFNSFSKVIEKMYFPVRPLNFTND